MVWKRIKKVWNHWYRETSIWTHENLVYFIGTYLGDFYGPDWKFDVWNKGVKTPKKDWDSLI